MAVPFYTWAKSQLRRSDAIGDVARDVCADMDFPREADTCPTVVKYLTAAGASDNCITAVVDAFREMRAQHPLRMRRAVVRQRIASPSLRARVLERDGFRCRRCGARAADGARLVIDHIHPFSKGGATAFGNLQTLCVPCNLGKGARLPHAHDWDSARERSPMLPPLDCAPTNVCRDCSDRLALSAALVKCGDGTWLYRCEHGHTWITDWADSCLMPQDDLIHEMKEARAWTTVCSPSMAEGAQ